MNDPLVLILERRRLLDVIDAAWRGVEEDRFKAEVARVLAERRREDLWAVSPVDHPAQPWEDHIMRAGPLRSSRTQKGPTDDTPQPVLCRR